MSYLSRLVSALAAGALLLSACGSSATVVGDVDAADAADASAAAATNESDDQDDSGDGASDGGGAPTEAPTEVAAAPTGQATGVLILSSGETFALVMRTCDTQATDPNSLLNDDFVEISADTPDGLRFTLLNARSAESPPAKAQVGLSGETDENGVNPAVDYVSLGPGDDPTLTPILVDGLYVSGQALLDGKFSSNKRFGDMVSATFEFTCA